jgi:hypothetical protein
MREAALRGEMRQAKQGIWQAVWRQPLTAEFEGLADQPFSRFQAHPRTAAMTKTKIAAIGSPVMMSIALYHCSLRRQALFLGGALYAAGSGDGVEFVTHTAYGG